ncbi:uncharacterized protein [Amphiura filiformis]|uniref:uncharacterized protein n=1 Tax=Amphiura filiformis TaxID=82378 RepID=UPI003B222B04
MKQRIAMDTKILLIVAAVMCCLISDAHGTNVRRATTGDKALDAILSGQYRHHLRYGKRFDPSLMKDNSQTDMGAFSALWNEAAHNPELKQKLTSYVKQMWQEASRDAQ